MEKIGSRNEQSEQRRRKIILAALSCFSQRGYSETSMAQIRRRSGASTGSIYHHFKSKEQLAASVYLEGISDYQDGFVSILHNGPKAREGIFALVRFHLLWAGEHPDWARFLFQMRHAEFMASTEKAFVRMNRDFLSGVSAWVRPHMKTGELRTLPWDIWISLLLGPCQEFIRHWLGGQGVSDLDVAIDRIGRAAWASLGPEKA